MTRIAAVVLCMSALAGCAGSSPARLGFTGAPAAVPPPEASDATIGMPGVRPGAGPYTPSLVPGTGGGRYFGY